MHPVRGLGPYCPPGREQRDRAARLGPQWLFTLLLSWVPPPRPPKRADVCNGPQGVRSPELDGYYLADSGSCGQGRRQGCGQGFPSSW